MEGKFSFTSVMEIALGVIIALVVIGLFSMAKEKFEEGSED